MGYILRRWLADALPAEITSGERVVALEVADQVNDDTRVGWPATALLLRRTGFKNEKQLGKVLGKLASNGWELRREVGEDRNGKPIFAHNGHRVTFRIPDEPPSKVPPAGELKVPQEGELSPEGPPTGAGSSPCGGRKLPPQGDPSPQRSPQEEPQISPQRPTAVERHLADYGLAEDERDPFVRWIEKIKNVHTPDGWIINAARNGTLGDRVTEWRDSIAPRPAANPRPPEDAKPEAPTEPCEHGTPGGQRCNLCVAALMYTELGGQRPRYLPGPMQAAWDAVAAARPVPATVGT